MPDKTKQSKLIGGFPNDPTGLRREFAIKFHRGDFIKNGEDNSELISDWYHQKVQKAYEQGFKAGVSRTNEGITVMG